MQAADLLHSLYALDPAGVHALLSCVLESAPLPTVTLAAPVSGAQTQQARNVWRAFQHSPAIVTASATAIDGTEGGDTHHSNIRTARHSDALLSCFHNDPMLLQRVSQVLGASTTEPFHANS